MEAYERELVDFWDANKLDLESIDQELDKFWTRVARPPTGAAGILKAAVDGELQNWPKATCPWRIPNRL